MSPFPAIAPPVADSNALVTSPSPCAARDSIAARHAIGRLSDRCPEDHDVLVELGNAALAVNETATARAWFEAALARDPARAGTWCRLAVAAQAQGDLDTAERCFRDALARAPALLAASLSLGTMLARCSRFDEAVAVLWAGHLAICDDPARARVDDDLALLNELRRLRPREPSVLLALGRAHAALGHDDVARACYLRLQRVPSWSGPAMAGLVGLETPVAARPWP